MNGELSGPYVQWTERPQRPPAIATVAKPEDPKALAKHLAGTGQEIQYTPEEHLTNIRLVLQP
jgi:hypothetical protein